MPQAVFIKFLAELLDVDEADAGTAIEKALETKRAASCVSRRKRSAAMTGPIVWLELGPRPILYK